MRSRRARTSADCVLLRDSKTDLLACHAERQRGVWAVVRRGARPPRADRRRPRISLRDPETDLPTCHPERQRGGWAVVRRARPSRSLAHARDDSAVLRAATAKKITRNSTTTLWNTAPLRRVSRRT